MISRRTYALAGVTLVMIVWGSTFVVAKIAVGEIPPNTLNVLRFLVAACVLVPIALARGGLARLPRPLPLVPLVLMSLTGIAIFHTGFNYGLVYASAVQGALVFASIPAAVAAAAIVVLKEAPTRRRIGGILLSIGGVALVVSAGEAAGASSDPLLGAAWMLAAVAAWTVYTVIAKRLADTDQIVVITVVSVLGMVMLIPLAAVELWSGPWPRPSLQGWLGVLFLGAAGSALTFIIYNLALRELDASLVGVYLNLDPIVGVLAAVAFLGESLGAGQIVGGAIALAGMWLASTKDPDSSHR